MLSELAIHNYAVISDLEVSFDDGLTIITGETGAGKSILVGAMNLILGGRASQEMIRTGEEEALIQAQFRFDAPHPIMDQLAEAGLSSNDEVIIRRSVNRSGRNRAFVNGQLVTVQQLSQLTRGLISISGQHEHQLLLDTDVHLSLLDRFSDASALLDEVDRQHRQWAEIHQQLAKLQRLSQERLQQMDFMKFQLQELESADLKPREDVLLENERKLLRHAATLHDAADSAHRLLYSAQGAVLDNLDRIAGHLKTLCDIDERQRPLNEHLEQAQIHLDELSHALQQYASEISFDPHRLAEVEDRLALIQRLCRKSRCTVDQLLERRDELRNALAETDDPEMVEKELQAKLEKSRTAYLELALKLSGKRRQAAETLARKVEQTLTRLDLGKARFAVGFDPERMERTPADSTFTARGIDTVEFLLSANPGEDLKPLARVASGGELSRVFLALKSLLSFQNVSETLIFDEVDTGIGGRTAELVGRQLQRLARQHQVICITHLPQIACYGQNHYQVIKRAGADTTHTAVEPLSEQQRVEELARMLGGISISEKTRAHAREWLERSRDLQRAST